MQNNRLFCFGLGYSALVLAQRLSDKGWHIAGTCRSDRAIAELTARGLSAFRFERVHPLANPAAVFAGTTHLLLGVPPDAHGDPVFDLHGGDIARLFPRLVWAGYLSTTGVYGDTGGTLVDESSPLNPSGPRQRKRVAAEQNWLSLHDSAGLPLHIFRLAGIYGPGRSALDQVRAGTAKRIDKPGHLFSRIHVEDITNVLMASIARPRPGTVYNVCDDEPATPADVIAQACDLLKVPAPPLIPFATAELTPMAASFWRDNRIVSNRRIKQELGVRLLYPNYRVGLASLAAKTLSPPESRSRL
ncbi:MAG: SDR family oxidoreductase [Rhodospirillaceae bacterium]